MSLPQGRVQRKRPALRRAQAFESQFRFSLERESDTKSNVTDALIAGRQPVVSSMRIWSPPSV